MGFLPHVVKATAGIQSAVVEKFYYYENLDKPAGQQYTLFVDVKFLGTATRRAKLRHIRYVGPLTFTTASTSAANTGRTVHSGGGFYDDGYLFLISAEGGALTFTARMAYLQKLLEGKAVTVQNIGGRWVAT